jgi:alpha-L-fucosidase
MLSIRQNGSYDIIIWKVNFNFINNPMKNLKISITLCSAILLGLISIKHASGQNDQNLYQPTRESLSKYQVPEWYHDAKIGFFYHWGPSSVPGDHFDYESIELCRGHEYKTPPGQYGSHLYATRGGEPDILRQLHTKWYGPPESFGYKELIPLLTGAKWDPVNIVELLDKAGVKYIVPMAIHHDGFAMWDSKLIDVYNAAKMGPKQNTTGQIIEEARKRGIKVGVSTHVCRHSWYFVKSPEFDSGDPRYEQLYGEGKGEDGLPKPEAIQKWENTLDELIQMFHPDYIFVDGGTADTYSRTKSYVIQDAFRRIVANYYNSAEKWGGEPVISYKRESLFKEEAMPDYEGGGMAEMASYKWQTHIPIAGWFYRVGVEARPSYRPFRRILDVVSKNGNIMLNLSLKADGSIRDSELAYLKDMEQWMNVMGEGIHATRAWLTYGENEPGKEVIFFEKKKGGVYDDPEKMPTGYVEQNKGDIRYTRSKDNSIIYASRLSWPDEPFMLYSFAKDSIAGNVKIKSLSLLGSSDQVNWKQTEKGIEITPSETPVFQNKEWPVCFKMLVQD